MGQCVQRGLARCPADGKHPINVSSPGIILINCEPLALISVFSLKPFFVLFILFYFFFAMKLAGAWFPNQGLNPGL